MKATYFETLHREEARRAEWRMLDSALQTRRATAPRLRRYRSALGHAMIELGTRLAGEQRTRPDSASYPCQ
ncbi:MAG TPA: hypothetical protein VFZ66_11895 [Herpetosiphonaceae bacterium]